MSLREAAADDSCAKAREPGAAAAAAGAGTKAALPSVRFIYGWAARTRASGYGNAERQGDGADPGLD